MAVVRPPVEMALLRAEKQVPTSSTARPLSFESKMDGWRGVLFPRDGVLQSRRDNNLADRFPELFAAATSLGDVVLDGEIVAHRDGRLDFGSLAGSPRTRAESGAVIYYVAFDLLAEGHRDHRSSTYQQRRARLEQLMHGVPPPLQLMPATTDRDQAMTWMDPACARVGIEGVVVKPPGKPYRPGRADWIKVRSTVVVDAVVVGVTGDPNHPTELVLARPDPPGALQGIGLSHALSDALRAEAGPHLALTGEGSRKISTGVFGRPSVTEYRPVHPSLVVEVRAESSVLVFTNRQRPRVHRVRLDLSPDDVVPERDRVVDEGHGPVVGSNRAVSSWTKKLL
ncbi:hypothetical protein QRX50_19685 [Amycolatopsis carbonis]|uniref:ATP-dependent DNA ligase family profile domain-containing protein n=1 Tax=Amycolatopsis carbonis TaxID=715471 RepID=A0A9Y2MZP8_9PSEU|nr:hypothetical protein [Amycolatopsis sp. 2-15]WIX82838.1 hypothetical protein QRX50_19685 [Amycolatopsis sp. 2-15]